MAEKSGEQVIMKLLQSKRRMRSFFAEKLRETKGEITELQTALKSLQKREKKDVG